MHVWGKGSYTVEAAWVMGIALSLLCAGMLLGYQVFYQTIAYVTTAEDEINAVTLFRQKNIGNAVLEEVK
jgi:hypothetical protein